VAGDLHRSDEVPSAEVMLAAVQTVWQA